LTDLPAIAVLEAGAEGLDGNPSPGQRIAFFPDDDGDGSLYTDDALALLDAVIAHALASLPMGDPNDCNNDGAVDINDTLCATVDALGDILTAANLIQGDADGNGEVAFGDFVILADHFGQDGTYPEGNFDLLDGVAFPDFVILANNFGRTSAAPAAVPEPSGWLLSLFLTCAWAMGRRVNNVGA
jgi:hypothetical protein